MKYISVSGPVAAGKTTLLNRLMTHYGSRALAREEKPQDNPFIREYYADATRWSFHSQVTFLALYFDRADWLVPGHELYFFDRCLTENLVIARYRMETGALTADEFAVLEKLANGIGRLMPPIDRYIYLKCSEDTLLSHAHSRGRDYEAGIDRSYASHQKRLYDAWAETLPPEKTLVVDADHEIDLAPILRFIEED